VCNSQVTSGQNNALFAPLPTESNDYVMTLKVKQFLSRLYQSQNQNKYCLCPDPLYASLVPEFGVNDLIRGPGWAGILAPQTPLTLFSGLVTSMLGALKPKVTFLLRSPPPRGLSGAPNLRSSRPFINPMGVLALPLAPILWWQMIVALVTNFLPLVWIRVLFYQWKSK